MNRRDVLKSGLFVALASAFAYKLGSRTDDSPIIKEYVPTPFRGARNSGFVFSVPLPFDFKLIDELVKINQTYKKSKVKTLYGSLPANSDNLLGFVSTNRGENPKIDSFKKFAEYVEYAQSRGFEFVYLINSAKPFTKEEFQKKQKLLFEFLDKLLSINCKNIKVANYQLLDILRSRKEFNIEASTSFEYTNIRQIEYFLEMYPRITKFNLAIDSNKNIPFLMNLKKRFKNVKFELMLDEFCVYGCPTRITHTATSFCFFPCWDTQKGNLWKSVFLSNIVYPWNIDLYADIGIKDLKLMGKYFGYRASLSTVSYVRDYFEIIENGLGRYSVNDVLHIMGAPFHLKENIRFTDEIISLFPDVNYFIANGDKCSSRCDASCSYCVECANNIGKRLKLFKKFA